MTSPEGEGTATSPEGEATAATRTRLRRAGRVVTGLVLLAVWAGTTVLVGMFLFLTSSRELVVAGHDAVVRPTTSGYAVLRPGAVLPDVRMELDSPIGVEIALGKTEATSTEELVQRYAFIASQPDAQIQKVTDAVTDMALAALLRGAVAGAVPVGLWLLIGARRRRELLRRVPSWQGGGIALAVVAAGVVVVQPWDRGEPTTADAQEDADEWQSLAAFIAPAPLPDEVPALEVRADVTTVQSRRLVESAVSTYESSLTFYNDAAERAADLELRQPADDETVVVLVSDRHDNIGMDPVARAIGDAGGARAVFNAGDDTSTGQPWEAFSLDSVNDAFGDLDRYSVVGNHDSGAFVGDYLGDLGWTRLAEGDVVDGPGGVVLMGVDDPRSSGLGNWRDEPGLTFDEVRDRITEAACEADERIGTLLVHDANLGRDALAEGCVDLVVGGHIHVRSGPTEVVGENGEVGYTYTSGTTGGAAYAIAVGSKPRRPAETTLITYRDGRAVGMQWVVLQTNGRFDVGEYVELTYGEALEDPEGAAPETSAPGETESTPAAPEDTASAEDDG